MKKQILISILLLVSVASLNAQQSDFPKLTGPYLGQKPPGKTAEPFGFSITGLQQNLHSAMVFSADGNEAYWKPGWNPREPIYTSRLENGRWTAPKIAPFSSPDQGDDSPFFSPDGKKLFFLSRRGGREKPSIWVMDRVREGWSEPKPLPIDAGSAWIHWQLSVDREDNVYFGARIENVGDIFVSRYKNGRYLEPEKLGPEVNKADEYDYSPFVSPDGRVLIFTRSQTPPRLFISYRKNDGTWTEAKDLSGTIGSDRSQNPFVTADGKYLLFTTGGRIQWVDAGFIEELRPKAGVTGPQAGHSHK